MYDQATVLFKTLPLQNYAWSQPHQDRHRQPRTGTPGNRRAPARGDSLQDAFTAIIRQQASGQQAGVHERQPSHCWDSTHHNQMSTSEHALPRQLQQLHFTPTIYKQHFSPLPAGARSLTARMLSTILAV